MSLGTYTATLNGQPATLLGFRDANSNLGAVHALVSSAGVEVGTSSNPLIVSVTGTAQATQAVTIATLPALSAGTATIGNVGQVGGPWAVSWTGQSVSLTGALPPGTNQLGSVNIAGTVPVTGTFFQATQPVSALTLPLPSGAATAALQPAINGDGGSLAHITNFPASQAVTVSNTVAISAAAPLPITGTINATTAAQYNSTPPTLASGASGPLQADASGRLLVTGSFSASTSGQYSASLPTYTNGQATTIQTDQNGRLLVGNFPASQVVTFSGQSVALASNTTVGLAAGATVSVSNLPTTQAVSVASLPLPAGAATAAGQPALNGDGGALAHVMNFPATQAVSVATLPPLAAGTATIGNVGLVNGTGITLVAGNAIIGTVGVIGGNVTAVKTDASATTQPISASSLPLPLGAALSAKQPQIGAAGTPATDVMTFQGIVGGTPLPVGGAIAIGSPAPTMPISVSGVDASGNKQHLRVDAFGAPSDTAWSSGSGSLVAVAKAIVAAAQSTTAAVTASSIVPPTPIFTQTTAATSSLVLKASPGSLYACFVTTSTTAGYLMLFDAVSAPANGTVAPKNIIYCPANGTTEVEMPFLTAEPFATGIVAVFSTTGPYTLTASPAAFIKGIAQ